MPVFGDVFTFAPVRGPFCGYDFFPRGVRTSENFFGFVPPLRTCDPPKRYVPQFFIGASPPLLFIRLSTFLYFPSGEVSSGLALLLCKYFRVIRLLIRSPMYPCYCEFTFCRHYLPPPIFRFPIYCRVFSSKFSHNSLLTVERPLSPVSTKSSGLDVLSPANGSFLSAL